ncbi:Na(+)-translocating NADH-quinone reductase subunit F [Pseudalgibacter alginicilyticus]|uniref:Na(+)-translocating NADH-quinone reductase subunit F n=1 Tax=Pseudalgibacter alginicilyticus TaxID=1736674 RepID=A0A0N7HYB4_9FLAO|nr:hypothetical protein [Pseudalgibacter alginicilyticus]ALJ04782.1 Na(+)-translocating NADH-quinone reductase subunit F [Pseudalgibacter alginicilyticus]
MKTTIRLEQAIQKLYIAFHNNTLHPECCKQCAVGNILDNTDSWKHLTDNHGTLKLNYVGMVHQNVGRKFKGYTPLELLEIEITFLKGCGYELPLHYKNKRPKNSTDKNVLFHGLCEVIKLLCKWDNVSNVMDYTNIFDLSYDKPRNKTLELKA